METNFFLLHIKLIYNYKQIIFNVIVTHLNEFLQWQKLLAELHIRPNI